MTALWYQRHVHILRPPEDLVPPEMVFLEHVQEPGHLVRLTGLPGRLHGLQQVVETEAHIASAPIAAILTGVALPAAINRLPRPLGQRTQGAQMIQRPPQFRHLRQLGWHVQLADSFDSMRLEDANHEGV